ncbi:MAG: hypothetical protein Q9225_003821 [Loekoesia sp. 1 TL-2023]
MPEEDSLPETLNTDHRSRNRHRWREKLSRWDSKTSENSQLRDQEIQSFLHAPDNERAIGTTPDLECPSKSDLLDIRDLPSHASPSPARRKSPRKSNLHVKFAATEPLIIGEGGDEAALPVTELLPSLALSSKPPVVALGKSGVQPLDAAAPERVSVEDPSVEEALYRPRSLQRRSTGLRDQDPIEYLVQASKPISWHQEQATASHGYDATLQSGTLERDSYSLGSVLPEDNRPLDVTLTEYADKPDVGRDRDHANQQEATSAPLQIDLLDPATSFANSLTPLPSPQPPRNPHVSLDSGPLSVGQHTDDRSIDPASQRVPKEKMQQPPRKILPKLMVENRGVSLRSVAKGLGDDALVEFATRVQPYRSVFILGFGSRSEPTLQQLVALASWWFLKGRTELESSVRSQPRNAASGETAQAEIPRNLKQAYVDLAKSWWIVTEVTPTRHPEVSKMGNRGPVSVPAIMHSFVDAKTAELIQIHLSIVSSLRALTMSMKRNSRLPPQGLELQGLDTRIFAQNPLLSPSAARLLSLENSKPVADENGSKTISFFPMPITDTERHFNYGRMFVDVILNQGEAGHQIIMPCLLSVLRDRKERDITMVVASQDGQVHLVIQPGPNVALSWQHVRWKTQHRYIEIDLRADFGVRVQFTDKDFRTVWGIHDYIRTIRQQSQGSTNEVLLIDKVLRSFQYFESRKDASQFPTEPIECCTLRLFECFRIATEGVGERKIHDGYRLMVTTARKVKTLSSVSHNLGRQNPIVFSYLRDEHGAPAMLLKMSKSSRDPSMVMSFQQEADRELLYSLLNGTSLSSDEVGSDTLSLENYTFFSDLNREKALSNRTFNWERLRVLGRRGQQLGFGGHAIRICAECDMGTIVDRVNLGPEELRIRLDCEEKSRIEILRAPQSDLTACFVDNALSKEDYESLRRMLDYIAQSRSLRIFDFCSLNDLHTFQALSTGFSVLFDGFAKTFAISRRRMVVPIHKRWEASITRLQVVRHHKMFQLVAFFQNFSHGSCMNFVLKSTDVFESFSRSGISYLCIVDAKFALPKQETDPDHQFVSLGMPEYPGEHDDITIGFATDLGKLIDLTIHSRIASAHCRCTVRRASSRTNLPYKAAQPHDFDVQGLSALHAVYVCLNPKRVSIGGGYHGSHGVLAIHQKLCGTEILPLDCPASDMHSGDVIHLETPLNPTGEAYNIKVYAEKAHSRGAILLVDATFGPPGLQDPFEWGADIVMHSGSKYLGGHSDMLCGVLATRKQEWLAVLKNEREFLGSVMGSMEGWLGVRSLRTLDLRVKRQSENASKLVQWLDICRKTDSEDKEAAAVKAVVQNVQYASLQHEDMHWLKKQMPHGFGPAFLFWVKEEWMAKRLPSLLSLFHHATSLGAVESLIEWRSMSDETVDRRVLRVSVGVEDWKDLKADLLKAFRNLIDAGNAPRAL